MKPFILTALAVGAFLMTTLSCNKNDFLPDSDKNVLFAVPSASEIDGVLDDWQKRDLTPTDYQVVQETPLLDNKFKLKIVSFKVSGIKEYGALLVPEGGSLLPVRMLIGGFGYDITTNSFEMVVDNSLAKTPFILAIPALRVQSLSITINGVPYSSPISEGEHCDAFDGATDDALAFLNLIQQTENKADVNRTSIRGGSRGCTVALLAGVRDKRIKRVVGVAGPTDFVTLTAANENDMTYQCQFLDNVKNNPTGLADARKKLIASSPIYFAKNLPLTQLHLGLNDKIVPVAQGYALKETISKLRLDSLFQLFTYSRTHTDIATSNAELNARIEEFLSEL